MKTATGRKVKPITDIASTALGKEGMPISFWVFGMNSIKEGAMWRTDPLLGKDLETNETTAIARQQPVRQWTGWLVIMWGPQHSTHNNRGTIGNTVFYAVRAKGSLMR
jgi:hypothetical protein